MQLRLIVVHLERQANLQINQEIRISFRNVFTETWITQKPTDQRTFCMVQEFSFVTSEFFVALNT